MQQYSPKNQAFLLLQLPTASDVRPFKAWKAAGRSVIKGEKALRVWIPKQRADATTDPAALTEEQRNQRFVRGPVFDISQTKESAPRHKKSAQSAATDYTLDQQFDAFPEFAAAIERGDIPADFDFHDWYSLSYTP